MDRIIPSHPVQYASGEVSLLHVWDMDREMLSASVPMQTDAAVVALVSVRQICDRTDGRGTERLLAES